jgi:hypothetical protein
MVVTTTVPDRSAVRDSLAAGLRPPAVSAVPNFMDVPMRPAPEMVLPPGSTAVWGMVRLIADGSSVPGTLLRLRSVFGSSAVTVTTQAGPDGSYLLVLPGEVPNRTVSPPRRAFERALEVFAPDPALAVRLAQGFLSGMPPDLLANDPAASDSPLQARGFSLRDASGTLLTGAGGSNPDVPVVVGSQVRWDVELGA